MSDDDKKCPKCGAEAVSYGCAGPRYKCGRIGKSPFGIHPKCEERQIATLTDELTRLRELDTAFKESPYDLSPCRDCGKPVLCIPEGLSVQCPACRQKGER